MRFTLHNTDGSVQNDLYSAGPGRTYYAPATIATWQGFTPPNEGGTCILIGRFGSRSEYRREGDCLVCVRVLDRGDVGTYRC